MGEGRGGGDSRHARHLTFHCKSALLLAAALLFTAAPTAAQNSQPPPDRPELSWGRSADYDYDPPVPGSYALSVIRPAGDGLVLDARGRERSLRDVMAGRLALLSFIYTRCSDPQGCPLATGLLYDLLDLSRQDPAVAKNLRLISLSFDPEHDTPEVMADYGGGAPADDGEASDWLFLTTQDATALRPILAAYGQVIGEKADRADPFGPFTHQLRLYLIDRKGQVRNIYSLGFLDPRLVMADIRTLLLEEARERPEG